MIYRPELSKSQMQILINTLKGSNNIVLSDYVRLVEHLTQVYNQKETK